MKKLFYIFSALMVIVIIGMIVFLGKPVVKELPREIPKATEKLPYVDMNARGKG